MNFNSIREQFPLLNKTIYGKRLAYLDSAATTQKPDCVLKALNEYYSNTNANVHRGVHYLSNLATEAFEATRTTVQTFLNAKEAKECIFTRSTTEAINLVAHCFGEVFVKEGDEILVSEMEHHSNLVPWQMLCQRKRATLKIIPINEKGELRLETLDTLLSSKTKLLALPHVSNALGTINPIETIIKQAKAKNIPVLIDGAQAVPHLNIDVQALDCDFYTFSSHKIYGPTGVGVLYGKKRWLEQFPPYQGGGEMILKVTLKENECNLYNDLPYKFEAGTPAIAEVIAFKTALDFFKGLPLSEIRQHEQQLLQATTTLIEQIPRSRIIGTATQKIGVVSFTLDDIHPHDIGTIADQHGVALRTGHHCAMPVMDFFKIPATARVSFGVYNTEQDVAQLKTALTAVLKLFKK